MHTLRFDRFISVFALTAAVLSACGGGGGGSAPAQPTLTVAVAGSGFVVSTPAGIDCHLDCTKAYAAGTVVTLVPFAITGQTFTGWSGDADCADGSVTMDAARNCTATFQPTGGPHIMAGKDFSVARNRSGLPTSWGADTAEALGNGAAGQSRNTPGPMTLLQTLDAVATAPAAQHGLAIERSTGRVWGWGSNASGQLGDGTQTNRGDAVLMRDTAAAVVSSATAVAVGASHSLVLLADGRIMAVGGNSNGQMGNGTTASRSIAAVVPNACAAGVAATAIAAGSNFSLALCADGVVRAWGANAQGQLGDGTFVDRTTPVTVRGLTGQTIKAIAAGGEFAVALNTDGVGWAWGSNARGQLGTDIRVETRRSAAANIGGFFGGVSIVAGLEHAVVLLANNVVFAWGANDSGQVSPLPGSGTTIDASFRVDGLPAIVEIAAGQNHSLAIDRNGTVWAWGGNASGQLGLGTTTSPSVPTAIPGLNLN